MKELAERNNLKMPFIYDGTNQILANYFNINITPAVVYLGKNNNLIYKGKIGEITPFGKIDTSYFEKNYRWRRQTATNCDKTERNRN